MAMARWRRSALVVALLAFAATLAQAQPVLGDVSLYTDDFTFDPFPDLPADFGPAIPDEGIDGLLLMADPEDACEEFTFSEFGETWVALIARAQRPHPTNCTFDVKVRNAEKAGASAAIVFDDAFEALIIMSKPPGNPEPGIPSVFVSAKAGLVMRKLLVPGSTRVHLTPVSAIAWMSMVMSAFLGFLALTVVIATFYVMRSWSAWLGRTRTRRGAPGELTYVLLHGPDAAGMSSAAIHALPTVVYTPRSSGKRRRAAAARRRGAAEAGLVGGGEAGDALTERLLPATAECDEVEETGLLPRTAYEAATVQGDIEAAAAGGSGSPEAAAGSRRQRRRRRGQQRGGGGGAPVGGPSRLWAAAAAADNALAAHDGSSDAAAASGAAVPFLDGCPASPGDAAAACDSDGALSSSSGSGGSSSGGDGAAAAGLPPGSRGGATRRTCVICLERYRAGETISILPCSHRFHVKCVSSWLAVRRFCPVCKRDASEPPPAVAGGGAGASGADAGGAVAPRGAMLQVWLLGLRARLRRAAAAAEGGGGGGGIPLAVAVDPGIVVALLPEAPTAAAAVAAASGGRLDIEEGGGGGSSGMVVPGATPAAAAAAPGFAAVALPGLEAAGAAAGSAAPSASDAGAGSAAAAPSVAPAGTSSSGAAGASPPTSGLRGRGTRAAAARDAGML